MSSVATPTLRLPMLRGCRSALNATLSTSCNEFKRSSDGSTQIEFCRKEIESMESRIYSALLQFNQGIEQAVTALDTLEKLEMQSPEWLTRTRERLKEFCADTNYQLCAAVGKKEDKEAHYFFNLRFNREEAERNPDQ